MSDRHFRLRFFLRSHGDHILCSQRAMVGKPSGSRFVSRKNGENMFCSPQTCQSNLLKHIEQVLGRGGLPKSLKLIFAIFWKGSSIFPLQNPSVMRAGGDVGIFRILKTKSKMPVGSKKNPVVDNIISKSYHKYINT